MPDPLSIQAGAGAAGLFDPLAGRADKLIREASANQGTTRKIDQSAKEFEALLLTSWLQHAYESFGAVPGADSDSDLDSGHDQFQSIAIQSLGEAISAAGGIGIAKMIASRLHKDQAAQATDTNSQGEMPETRTQAQGPSNNPGND